VSELTGSLPRRVRRRERRPRWARALGYLFLVVAVLLSAGLGVGLYFYYHLNGKIQHPDLPPGATGATPKREVVGAQNWLIMGSDSRDCKGCAQYGRELVNGGARSDTTILAHLSRGASQATLVSIPRDSWVQIPACRTANGMSTPQTTKFNEAFSLGGPACTIKTVQSLTHVAIDHWVVVNFDGFKKIVDALNGVRVCLSQPIDDPIVHTAEGYHGSGLVLSAGYHTLNGATALKFVRARYAVGDGSDLTRIKDQQAFISAMIRKVADIGLLFHPTELVSVLNAIVESLATDKDVSLSKLADFGESLHGLPPSKVDLLTVPLEYNAPGVPSADVAWDPTLAPELWDTIRKDAPLPGTVQHHRNSKPSKKQQSSNLTVPPSAITVNVLNGTTQAGIAHNVASQLQALGYQIGQIGDAPAPAASTFVEYGPTRVQSSETLAAAVGKGVDRKADPTLGDSVTLVIGPDFPGVHSVTIGSPSPSASPSPTNTLGITNAAADRCAVG
jgi:LCP family protein required for cell wall assembly